MHQRTSLARPAICVAAIFAMLAPGLVSAVPKVVVPGTSGNEYAAPVEELRPLSESVPVSGAVARAMGFYVNGVADSKIRTDLFIGGYQALTDPVRSTVNSFNGAGRFGWELPTAILFSSTQVLDGKPLPYGMGVSWMCRHHLAASQRVNGWAPLIAFGQLNQPWSFALLTRNGVPVLAHEQQNGAFFDLGSEAVGHQPTLRIDDGKWHHIVLNFSQPANPNGCGGTANATCSGRGLLRLFVDGALVNDYHTTLTSNIRQVTVGALAVTAGEYNGQNNWQANPPMLLARGQIDDVALYQRALSGQKTAKLQHRAETGLIAVWPDPGAAGEANSPMTGFVPKTDPLFFVNPANVGNANPVNAAPPLWDLFSTNGFSAAITVQPNDQKWLYVRKNATNWFGFYHAGGLIDAACGSKPFTVDSDQAGNNSAVAWVDWGYKHDWFTLQVSQSGGKTRVSTRYFVHDMNCPAIPLLDGYDYARLAGESPATPANVARVMLFRRALGIDELAAEAFPGPLVWADAAQLSGT